MAETDESFTSIMEGSDFINDLLNEVASASNATDQDDTAGTPSDTEESLSPEEVIRRLDAINLMTDQEEKDEGFHEALEQDESNHNENVVEESLPLPSTETSAILPPPVAFNVNTIATETSEENTQGEHEEYRSEDDEDQFISAANSDIAEEDEAGSDLAEEIVVDKEENITETNLLAEALKAYDETMDNTPSEEEEETDINHEETDQFTPEEIVSNVEDSELVVQDRDESASCTQEENEEETSTTSYLEAQNVEESTMSSENKSVLTTETEEVTMSSEKESVSTAESAEVTSDEPVTDHVETEALEQVEEDIASSAILEQSVVSDTPQWISTEDHEASESDSESESETDEPLHPPLNLGTTLGNDSDEELEVDEEVAASLLKEQATKKPLTAPAPPKAIVPSISEKVVEEEASNPLADALSAAINATETSKTKSLEPNDPFSSNTFASKAKGIEVRVASVTVPDSVMPTTSSSTESIENSFGIAYKSIKKSKKLDVSEKETGYTLPSKSLFPDEKEFEKDLEASTLLQQAVSFSTQGSIKKNKDQGEEEQDKAEEVDEVDEFDAVFVEATGNLTSNLSMEKDLELKRQRMEKKAAAEAQELLEQLKKATDQERKEIELETRMSAIEAEASAANSSATQSAAAVLEAQAAGLSLSDIHSMYKRGLGDQEVRMLDDNSSKMTSTVTSGTKPIIAPVLGAILKEPIKNEIIEEEEEEDDDDEAGEEKKVQPNNVASPQMEQEDEWKEIELTIAPTVINSAPKEISATTSIKDTPKQSLPSSPTALLKYNTATSYFFEDPELLSQHSNKIVPEDFKFNGCVGSVLNPKLKFPNSKDQRDRVFCIAMSTYDPRNEMHRNLLQTIYKKLMKNQRDVGAIGSHWEEIGFQGTDPSTDLRGCGLLSLLQLLLLVEKHSELAGKLHSLSHHPVRHFPMACTLINATLQCLVTLRSGKLYRQCNKTKNVMDAMNLLYVAITKRLHDEIKQDSNEAIPLIMKRVFEEAKAHPDKMIDGIYKTPTTFAQTTSNNKSSTNKKNTSKTSTQPINNAAATTGDIEFTEIGLHAAEE